MEFTEIVLPTGAFARVRPLRGRDYQDSQKMQSQGMDLTLSLIALSTMIDDKPLTYEQLLDMDLRDVLALVKHVSIYITGPVSTSK